MNLFKTSIYSGLSQATSVAVGLISVKIVASKIGPEGIALQGQFINSTAILSIISGAAIGAGVIKYLAEYKEDKDEQLKIIKAAITITAVSCIIVSLIPIIGAYWFAEHMLKDSKYISVYWIYGAFLPFITFNTLFSFILNGLKKIPALTFVNIFTSIINLIFLILLSKSYGVYGVLITASIISFFVFLLHLYFFYKNKWFSILALRPLWDKEIYTKFFKFSAMSLLAGLGMPFIQIIIRDKIIHTSGLTDAGYWQTVTRISDFYLSFLISVLSVYFLPKLSELKENHEIRKEIFQTGKVIIPAIILMSTIIWLGKDLLIKYLLTEKFLPTRPLFFFQLLGDIFKVGGWMLSNILWAKALTKKYLLIDTFSLLLYVGISYLCISQFGLWGSTFGFFVTYLIYFLIMCVANRKYLVLQKT